MLTTSFRTHTSVVADSTSLEMIKVALLALHELDYHWWFEHSFFGEILFVLSVKKNRVRCGHRFVRIR